jgi:flavoprotein
MAAISVVQAVAAKILGRLRVERYTRLRICLATSVGVSAVSMRIGTTGLTSVAVLWPVALVSSSRVVIIHDADVVVQVARLTRVVEW